MMKTDPLNIMVTGGSGFIGFALITHLLARTEHNVLNVDKMTYAARRDSQPESTRYRFCQADICNSERMRSLHREFQPNVVLHLAAETHVDRSLNDPELFVATNIVGTQRLLDISLEYWESLNELQQLAFRFHHVSTDEVFGALGSDGRFVENSAYDPSSPYSASKAAADHLVRAWHRSFGLPVLISGSSNNYGPGQFPDKLIPKTIDYALKGKPIPVYGDGLNVRDWLHVDDHASALRAVFEKGEAGQTYLVGARAERTNLDVIRMACQFLDEMHPLGGGRSYADQIEYVQDRPGHDFRYAIDPSKLEKELGWRPLRSFDEGLRETVRWFAQNRCG